MILVGMIDIGISRVRCRRFETLGRALLFQKVEEYFILGLFLVSNLFKSLCCARAVLLSMC